MARLQGVAATVSILTALAVGCSSEQELGKSDANDPPLDTTTTTSTTGVGEDDYDWHEGFDPTPDPEDPTTEDDPWDPSDPSDPEDPDGPEGDPDEFDDPPVVEGPPGETIDGCDGEIATVDTNELVVFSWDPILDTATVDAPVSGWFDLYNGHIVESGSGQWNETAYFRVTNGTNPGGEPLLANCDADWIVQDADNFGPIPGTHTYIGTFWLDAGANNTLEMHHYCERYRAGDCPQFHFTDDADSTCDSNNVNSVHFYGDGLCLVEP